MKGTKLHLGNKHLLFIISALIIALVLTIIFIRSADNGVTIPTQNETLSCVKASCCHASSCVDGSQAPDCSDTFCTQECVPGTLDCEQGSCQEVNGKCEAVFK